MIASAQRCALSKDHSARDEAGLVDAETGKASENAGFSWIVPYFCVFLMSMSGGKHQQLLIASS